MKCSARRRCSPDRLPFQMLSQYSSKTFSKDRYQWTKCVLQYLCEAIDTSVVQQMIVLLSEVGCIRFVAGVWAGVSCSWKFPGNMLLLVVTGHIINAVVIVYTFRSDESLLMRCDDNAQSSNTRLTACACATVIGERQVDGDCVPIVAKCSESVRCRLR